MQNYLREENKFTSTVTGKTYLIQEDLSWNGKSVLHLITCDKCKDKYIGSAVHFKPRFRVHENDVNT